MEIKRFLAGSLCWLALSHASSVPKPLPAANDILDAALGALGGEDAIRALKGVSYHAPSFRSRSLMQSYELNKADIAVAISGSQNVSFDFTSDNLRQRIDRRFTPSDYWVWSAPNLDPLDFSLVVKGGADGFACYVKGNNQIWLPTDLASGYTDAAYAEYLVLHGEMMSPHLLLKMKNSSSISSLEVDINGIRFPSVFDSVRNITVMMDTKTMMPYIVRTLEYHSIYGISTNDFYLADYKDVNGILFPHSIQTVYNATSVLLNAVLEDFVIDNIVLNPDYQSDFFDGIPEEKSMLPKSAPKQVAGISHARMTEFASNMLWSGSNNTAVDFKMEAPLADLPSVHWVLLDDEELGVKQMIVELEDQVIVCDAPPQWSGAVIEWVAKELKKPITYLWPTHHHRDHSGGADKYVEIGAKLIVPEMSVGYWSNIPGASLVTFNETHPFVIRDNKIQAWFMWQEQTTHSADWSYAVVTEKCPSENSSVAVLEADVWQAGMPSGLSDQALMHQWLDQVLADGLTDKAVVFPTHGQISPLADLINITGYPYPEVEVTRWQHGKGLC